MPDSHEADERSSLNPFGREEAESVILLVGLYSRDHALALFAVEERWKELHHFRIGAHGGKGLMIRAAPGPEKEAGCGDHTIKFMTVTV